MGARGRGWGDGEGVYGEGVTDLLCPPSNVAEDGSIVALKRCAHDFKSQQTTLGDDSRMSYLESVDSNNYNMLAIGRMIVD
jgi:hypothetical protein